MHLIAFMEKSILNALQNTQDTTAPTNILIIKDKIITTDTRNL